MKCHTNTYMQSIDTQSGSRHSHVSSITVSMLNMCKELLQQSTFAQVLCHVDSATELEGIPVENPFTKHPSLPNFTRPQPSS